MVNPWQWLQKRQARQVNELIRCADANPELTILWGSDSIRLVKERDMGPATPTGLVFYHTIREIHYISDNIVTLASRMV